MGLNMSIYQLKFWFIFRWWVCYDMSFYQLKMRRLGRGKNQLRNPETLPFPTDCFSYILKSISAQVPPCKQGLSLQIGFTQLQQAKASYAGRHRPQALAPTMKLPEAWLESQRFLNKSGEIENGFCIWSL